MPEIINNNNLQTIYNKKIREYSWFKPTKKKTLTYSLNENFKKLIIPSMENNYSKNFKNFKLGNFIRKGSFGEVYKLNGTNMIFKVIKNTGDDGYTYEEYISLRFHELLQKYLQSNDKLKLKYLCILHEYGFVDKKSNDSNIYAIMDNCGKELGQYINELKQSNNLTLEIIIYIMIECCKALEILHNIGYSHLDIKPQNFLVVEESNTYVVYNNVKELEKFGKIIQIKIIDFGFIAKKNSIIKKRGTRLYESPEMLLNEYITVNEKFDIFSLGCFFIQLILFYCYFIDSDDVTLIPICPIIPSIKSINENFYKSSDRLNYYNDNISIDKDISLIKSSLIQKYSENKNKIEFKISNNNNRSNTINIVQKLISKNTKFTDSIVNKITIILKKMIIYENARYSNISEIISDLEKVFLFSNNNG